jgi:hypothetical protein
MLPTDYLFVYVYVMVDDAITAGAIVWLCQPELAPLFSFDLAPPGRPAEEKFSSDLAPP